MKKHSFYNLEAERGVLGALFMDPGLVDDIRAVLEPGDFYQEQHAATYKAMLAVADTGAAIDPVLVQEHLANAKSEFADPGLFLELARNPPLSYNATHYARMVQERANKRAMYLVLQDTLGQLHNGKYNGIDPDIVRDELVKRLRTAVRLPPDQEPVKTTWTARELLHADFPEPTWVVPGVLPVGLAFLAGRPKVGKSWLGLQIAHAVGSGGVVLDRQVDRGRALYIAFEDGKQRLKSRLQKQGATDQTDLTFELSWPMFGSGGLLELDAAIRGQFYKLAVVDTLSRAAGMADQLDIGQMTRLLGELQRMAMANDCCILVIDHHRKPNASALDPIDDLIGSTAKSAVCDVALGLYKERGKSGAKLMLRGRDLEDIDLELKWDALTCCWRLLGEAGSVLKGSTEADVVQAARELIRIGELATVTNLAEHLDKDKGSVSRLVTKLVEKGALVPGEKEGRQLPLFPPT